MPTPRTALAKAARLLRAGGVIAYPTEAVFGLGCDPRNRAAVQRLLRIKRRSAAKGLILIAASVNQLSPYVTDIPLAARASWPGPRTWLLTPRPGVPRWLTGRHARIAVRVTAHALARDLCLAAGMALVSTSANRAGQAPARTRREVLRRFGRSLDYVLPGRCGRRRRPTAIVDAASGAVVRPG
jgi:L-threonylcarbamoyladenylate synthase